MSARVHESSFRPYFKHIFWPLVMLAVVFIVVADVTVYFVSTDHLFHDIQTELQQIATNVADEIPVDIHERLVNPDQQKSDDYQQIESYFQAVMDGNPQIDDIYTLRPTSTPHQMLFVVSGMATGDANTDGKIDESEQKPALGESYDTSDLPDLEYGLINASYDQGITYDKWGSWISGYAPLHNDHGQGVAVVGVDYSAQAFAQQRWHIFRVVFIVSLIILPVSIIIVYLLSLFFTRPFRDLAKGMSRVRHGDFTFRMPHAKGDEETFNHLFNGMLTVFEHSLEHKQQKEHEDKGITIDDERTG